MPGPGTSGFAAITRGRVAPARLSKATLAELSHTLEDLIAESDRPATVLAGFQSAEHWAVERDRYRRLAEPPERDVAVFAAGDLGEIRGGEDGNGDETHGTVLGVRLPADHPMRDEWFVIALTECFSCVLFGTEQPDDPRTVQENDRRFLATWSFRPDVVDDLCRHVVAATTPIDAAVAERLERALARRPVRTPDPDVESDVTRRMFETIEAGRERWRERLVEEQRLRERLVRAEHELARLERTAAVGATASALAHELNNPLAAIGMSAELIIDDARRLDAGSGTGGETRVETGDRAVADIVDAAEGIATATTRIGRLVRGMLDLVRQGEVDLRPVDLGPWLTGVVEELQLGVGRGIALGPVDGATVLADADRLRHVVTNLVRNAAEASERPVRIEVTRQPSTETASAGGDVLIRVIDEGSGIDGQVREKLFQPFVTTKQGASGLGLALARRFAEDVGGEVRLAETGPTGTVMELRLPLTGDQLAGALAQITRR